MAQTLEEFLISVKYNIDAPSQNTFFDAMKKAATSVAGVAGEMTGLSVAILTLAENMAKSGEKLYWMSQRVGDGVTDIQGMAFALSNLGISAGEATAGIERFGAWTRSMGPAATGYLQSLGVTATDTIGRMKQLGEYFRTHGGTAAQQGSLEYSLALRRWQMMGGDERSMLALSSGQAEQSYQQAGLMQRMVWGKDWQTGPQRFATQSVAVMNQFRAMGFFFDNLAHKSALGLFNAILPDLEKINRLFAGMLPHIQAFIDHVISYAPAALHFLEGMMKAFDGLIQLMTVAMETWDKIPGSLQAMTLAILAMPSALRLLGSPLFWILGGLTALLLLLDDYKGYQDDLAHPGQKTAYLNWGAIGDAFAPIINAHDKINQFIADLTGIHHGLELIAGLAVGLMATATAIKAIGVAAAFASGGGALAGILGRFAFAARWGLPLAAAVGAAGAIHEANTPGNVALSKRLFGDDSASSLGKTLIARTMGDMAGMSAEDWIKRNFPQWLDKEQKPAEQFGPAQPRAPINLGIGDFLSRAWQYLWHGDPGGNTAAPPTPGDPSARGIIPASYRFGGGGDDFFTPERFYTLLLFSFQTITEKLSGILDTLTDMAEGQGAPRNARGGAGAGGTMGAGPPATTAEMIQARDYFASKLGISSDAAAGLVTNLFAESGLHPDAVSPTGAKGLAQWISSRWVPLAGWAISQGLDPNSKDGQMAMIVHEIQESFPGLLAQLRQGGRGATAYADDVLRGYEKPPLTAGNIASHTNVPPGLLTPLGIPNAPDYNSPSRTLHNETHIHVTAPNPGSAAMQTAEQQERVFEHHIRFAKGALLA